MNLNDNLDKLPKWAQHEVEVLQMRLRESKKQVEQLIDAPQSNTIVGFDFKIDGEKTHYLKNGQNITFVLPDGNVHARIVGDYLEINASNHFSKTKSDMYIKPIVSNSFKVLFK